MLSVTERANRKTTDIDLCDGYEIVRLINSEDKKVAKAISQILPQIGKAVDEIAQRLKNGGRMAYFGCGTSGRIGILDAAEMPPTFGVSADLVQGYIAGGAKAICHAVENAEDSENSARRDLKKFAPTAQDVVVGISAAGNPRYVLKALQLARSAGALTIGITSNSQAAMKPIVDIFLGVKLGPEVITGSSRMKSGSAQKMILNMLSTGAMIRLGKTYKNYMIDLELNNLKLRRRAIRFICEITGVDEPTARQTLEEAQNTKIACVMLLCGCTARDAAELLRQNDGILRRVIL